MSTPLDYGTIRAELLRAVQECWKKRGDGLNQQDNVLREAVKSLDIKDEKGPEALALLAQWHDLFRGGYLSWGRDLTGSHSDNYSQLTDASPPWFHLTEQGEVALQNFSRDPANPKGYLADLNQKAAPSSVSMSYIQEALVAYNSSCHKATAVMVGVATESLILEIRDTLVQRILSLGRTPNKKLSHWMVKNVLEAIEKEIEPKKGSMLRPLSESYPRFWISFNEQIRIARNDAGHPTSIGLIDQRTAHALLLIFPALAEMAKDLQSWIQTRFS